MRVKAVFIDDNGKRRTVDIISPKEASRLDVYVESFKSMLHDALEKGDDVSIFIRRIVKTFDYIA